MTEEKEGFIGKLKVGIKEEGGMLLTKEHGFTIHEEEAKVLSFDRYHGGEYGDVLLFGDQIFFVKFWDTEDLIKARDLLNGAIGDELKRRSTSEPTSS